MQPSTITSLLIIAAISLTIGFIVGWLVSTLRADKPSTAASRTADAPPGHRGLLSLWRNETSGGLLVDLHGKQLSTAEGMSLAARKELADLLKETGAWMGLPDEPSAPPISAGTVVPTAGLNAPDELQRPSLIGGMTNVIADAVNPQTAAARRDAPKSIVQQIDEIFQAKLIGTAFEGQKIYITEDFRKGVIVWIENDMYEGVGSMPEGEVKKLLRESVQEWEKRQEQARRRAEKA